MPGTLAEADELHRLATAPDQQVGRDLQVCDGCEVGMSAGIERIGKKLLDKRTAELTRRKTDAVNDNQLGLGPRRPVILVR